MQETTQQLKSVISQFIHLLHEASGNSISHVTVTVHGQLQHFVPERRINTFAVSKIEGVTQLCYQDMEIEAPIPNMITIIATDKQPPLA
jgi:hypothetical protein